MYDLIVIGGGPGGYLAAERAGHAGLNTLIIEKRALGGVCLNEGCIPSKTFLNSAKVYEHAKDGAVYGVTTTGASIDQKAVVRRKNKVVKQLVAGVKALMKANKVTVVNAEAKIDGKSPDGGFNVLAGGESYVGKNLIIAAGSEAIVPPIPGVKEGVEAGYVLTNREILDLEVIPEKLVIVGGGVIGLEMASYFQTVGSQVTVIEMLDHIAGSVDLELGALLQKNYAKKGIEFKLNCKVVGVDKDQVRYEEEGSEKSVASDYVLLSIGRRAATQSLGLETINVYTERGHIVTDDNGRTNIPGVYAVGDVNGRWMLAHAAYREAEVAVSTILGIKDVVRYNALASVIYTNPELAYAGESEESAAAKGINYKKVTIPMSYSGRYLAETDRGDGVCKLIVDADKDRLIGCHLLGSYASEIIMSAAIMIETQMRVSDIKELIFPHPTVAEIIREAIFMLK